MKFSKFINKKMIIFVILFSAFLYFSGSFNVMREGYTPPGGTLTIKNMKCDNCLRPGSSYVCSDECKKFVSDNNITSSEYEANFVNNNTYFKSIKPKIFNGNCTGCRIIPNPTNLPCDGGKRCNGANAREYNCVFDEQTGKTTCTHK